MPSPVSIVPFLSQRLIISILSQDTVFVGPLGEGNGLDRGGKKGRERKERNHGYRKKALLFLQSWSFACPRLFSFKSNSPSWFLLETLILVCTRSIPSNYYFHTPPHFHSQNIIRLALRSRKNSGSRWRNQRRRMSNLKHCKVVVQGLSARSSPKILGDEIQEYFPHSSCFSCSFCTRGAFLGSLFNGAYAYTKLLAAESS